MRSSIEFRSAGYADIVEVAGNMRSSDKRELYAYDPTENPENSLVTWPLTSDIIGLPLAVGGRLSS